MQNIDVTQNPSSPGVLSSLYMGWNLSHIVKLILHSKYIYRPLNTSVIDNRYVGSPYLVGSLKNQIKGQECREVGMRQE